jgi:23S rRNA G2445 N2-methylase RlmL
LDVVLKGSRLRDPRPLKKKLAHAIADALRGPRQAGRRAPRDTARVLVRVMGDRAQLSLDVAGEPLFKRGWRTSVGPAPLRENFAAAVLRLAGWGPDVPLVDPFCGSGTFPIEAGTIALGRGLGGRERPAFAQWPSHDLKQWAAACRHAGSLGPAEGAPIWGSDHAEEALRAASDNARRAGVANRVRWSRIDFRAVAPPADRGLLVCNPPYGKRIGTRSAISLYAALGSRLREAWGGWRAAVIAPVGPAVGALGLGEPMTVFDNGGLRVALIVEELR